MKQIRNTLNKKNPTGFIHEQISLGFLNKKFETNRTNRTSTNAIFRNRARMRTRKMFINSIKNYKCGKTKINMLNPCFPQVVSFLSHPDERLQNLLYRIFFHQ